MVSSTNGNNLSFHTGHNLHAKDTIRIPESHTLHVGPAACARRHAIKALENGDAENMSYLAISEEDLAAGTYEQQIADAVMQLNSFLPKHPRIIIICLKCVDDLIGTDADALIDVLERSFPSQRFATTRIDPIALSKTVSPGEYNKATLYQFIEPDQTKDQGITLVGSFTRVPADCEMHEVMREWGMGPLRCILDCENYQDYQDLGKSRLILCAAPMGKKATRELHDITGASFFEAPWGYSPPAIACFYRTFASLCGKLEPADLPTWETDTEEELRVTAQATAEFKFAVDSSACMQSFLLAKTLLERGFNVICITTKGVTDLEQDAHDWIVEHFSDTQIVRSHSYKALTEGGYGLGKDLIVIGADFARIIGAQRAVDIWHDEGLFAFQGISKLCRLIGEAAR